ncbi:MAG: GNAT family N-acetyltransferase [Lachnospiraceae bacterium]
MRVEIMKAQPQDAKRLAEVFNDSFYSDYVKYGECPGYNKTEKSMLTGMKEYFVYKIIVNGIIVGAISVKEEANHHYYLGALCVIPEYANKGIGQQAMRYLDKEYPHAFHWALETPTDKMQNYYFYMKLGYQVTKEYLDGSVPVSYFERQLQAYKVSPVKDFKRNNIYRAN